MRTRQMPVLFLNTFGEHGWLEWAKLKWSTGDVTPAFAAAYARMWLSDANDEHAFVVFLIDGAERMHVEDIRFNLNTAK